MPPPSSPTRCGRRFRPSGPAGRSPACTARTCSPAPSVDAIAAGQYGFVLGELHAAWSALELRVFVAAHPDPAALREYVRRDVGAGRLPRCFRTVGRG